MRSPTSLLGPAFRIGGFRTCVVRLPAVGSALGCDLLVFSQYSPEYLLLLFLLMALAKKIITSPPPPPPIERSPNGIAKLG